MRPASYGVSRLPAVIVSACGGVGLAAISFVDRGTSWMHTSVGAPFYWAAVGAPVAALLLRAVRTPSMRLPSAPWLALAAAAAGFVTISALASPWMHPVLQWSIVPLGAVAVFLLAHDQRHTDPGRAARLDIVVAVSAAVLMGASTLYWIGDVAALTPEERTGAVLFLMRNPHPLGHSNYTAGLALLGLPILADAARRHSGITRWIMATGAILSLIALFTSGSRGGLIGLAVLGVAAIATLGLGKRKLLLLGSGAVVAVALLAIANPRTRALLSPPDPAAAPNPSTVQRTAMLAAGIRMGLDRPLTGFGLGATPLAYPRYRARLDGGAENVLQLHSTPVELWAGLGGPGGALFVAALALALAGFRRDPAAGTALAGYAAFSLTDYQLDVPVIAFGVAYLAARIAKPGSQAGTGARWAAGAAAALALPVVGIVGAPDRSPVLNAEALRAGQRDEGTGRAIGLLRESLEINRDQEIAHFNLGWLLVVREPVKAEEHFREAARLVPDKGGVYFGLGLALLNQGNPQGAARSFAIECINDPSFVFSPWWREPAIAAVREETVAALRSLLTVASADLPGGTWAARQARELETLVPILGESVDAPEKAYRRERTGYPVLMRNHDIEPPIDLYVAREHEPTGRADSVNIPPKGWLPSPLLLKLLDAPRAIGQ